MGRGPARQSARDTCVSICRVDGALLPQPLPQHPGGGRRSQGGEQPGAGSQERPGGNDGDGEGEGYGVEGPPLRDPEPGRSLRHLMHLAEESVEREPDRQVEDHADHGGRDRGERVREGAAAAQPFDIGSAEEDPEEAGRKG